MEKQRANKSVDERRRENKVEIIERYCPKAGGNVVLERYIQGNDATFGDEVSHYHCLHSHSCGVCGECERNGYSESK